MALTLHNATVGTYQQILASVSGFMDKGLAHCHESNIDPNEIVETRLYPDMAPFRFQILSVVHHSKGALEATRAANSGRGPQPPKISRRCNRWSPTRGRQ